MDSMDKKIVYEQRVVEGVDERKATKKDVAGRRKSIVEIIKQVK